MDPATIFQAEVEDSIEKINMALKVLKKLKSVYREHRRKLHTYFDEGDEKLWEFPDKLVFQRYDSFYERAKIIKVRRMNRYPIFIAVGSLGDI